jgi:hypothetical protein
MTFYLFYHQCKYTLSLLYYHDRKLTISIDVFVLPDTENFHAAYWIWMCSPTHFQIMLICFDPPYRTQSDLSYYYYPVCACHTTRVINIFISFHFSHVQMMEPGKVTTYTGHFRWDIPVLVYRITKYIGKI